jgi:hypothetical protein
MLLGILVSVSGSPGGVSINCVGRQRGFGRHQLGEVIDQFASAGGQSVREDDTDTVPIKPPNFVDRANPVSEHVQQAPSECRVWAPHLEDNERKPVPVAVRTSALTVENRAEFFDGANAVRSLLLPLLHAGRKVQIGPQLLQKHACFLPFDRILPSPSLARDESHLAFLMLIAHRAFG